MISPPPISFCCILMISPPHKFLLYSYDLPPISFCCILMISPPLISFCYILMISPSPISFYYILMNPPSHWRLISYCLSFRLCWPRLISTPFPLKTKRSRQNPRIPPPTPLHYPTQARMTGDLIFKDTTHRCYYCVLHKGRSVHENVLCGHLSSLQGPLDTIPPSLLCTFQGLVNFHTENH